MPTYEYLCEGCKKGFEVRLTITERTKAHVSCLRCGSKKVRPQLELVINLKTATYARHEHSQVAAAAGGSDHPVVRRRAFLATLGVGLLATLLAGEAVAKEILL